MRFVFRCFFVCSGFLLLLENFSRIWRCYNNRWSATHLDLFSTLVAIEQWELLSVSLLLDTWQNAYNGHLVGPVILTPIVYRFAVIVELPQPVLSTKTSWSWDSNTQHSTYGASALTDCVTAMFILWTRWNATMVYIEYRVESRPMYYFFYKSNHTEAISLRIITTFKGVKTPFFLTYFDSNRHW